MNEKLVLSSMAYNLDWSGISLILYVAYEGGLEVQLLWYEHPIPSARGETWN
jgi:hypothetical protein